MPTKKMNEFRMHQRIVQLTLLVLYFLLSYNGVQGEKKLFKLKDVELEKQLKLLNKQAIKTIKTKNGDIYDCIDFYKQHAFDHPLLKDHNFHPKMKPTLSRMKQNSDASTTSRSSTMRLKNGGCPSGTVPIKRTTKDDLIRQRSMPPPENVNFDAQFVGVDPTLYGDNQTRLFIHIQAGKIHCFNTLCPGFIIVNTEIPLGMSYEDNISERGGTTWEDTMYIQRVLLYLFLLCKIFIMFIQIYELQFERNVNTDIDILFFKTKDVVGNWWLLIGENYEQIGFWPPRIFTDLASFATNVEWGGVVYSPPGVPAPPMGSSFFPSENSAYDAYCRSIAIIDEIGWTVYLHRVIIHVDNHFMYKVLFERLSSDSKSFAFVLYGGPGESAPV
ncbi:protein neprosin-like [Lycium ferocissimum]|uniref:protein neprosin-like n=1 Tax=Lycium ferocissimum TaxID=112874 RepID=UPI002814CFEB|nr:protein neprosin-like [Lycium ferocissimum]